MHITMANFSPLEHHGTANPARAESKCRADRDIEAGSDCLAQAIAGSGKEGPPRTATVASGEEGEERKARFNGGRHVPADHH